VQTDRFAAQRSPSAAAEERSDEGTASARSPLAAVGCKAWLGVLWIRDFEITTDLPSQEVVDLAMARDGRYLPGQTVDVYGMVAALAKENTSMCLKGAG